MSDYRFKYWKEALECSLDDAGASGLLSDEVIERVASDLQVSAENMDMAFGYSAISCSSNSVIEELKRSHKAEIAEMQQQLDTYRNSVATRRGVAPSDVCIEGDSVMYRPR